MLRWYTPVLLFLCLLPACTRESTAATKPPPVPPVPVSVATVVQRDVPIRLHGIGNVEAFSTVTLKSRVAGQLAEVRVAEGQDVKKDDILFVIDPRPYDAALAQAKANLARDTATAKNLKILFERTQELGRQGAATPSELDQARYAADAAAATIQADEAAIDTAKLNLYYCTIRSPLDGRAGVLMVHQGNLIKVDDTSIMTINQFRPIYVAFTVPEQDLADVRRALARGSAPLVTATPASGGSATPVVGSLTFIDNNIDPATGTLRLKATFDNTDDRLWPGLFVSVDLTLHTQSNAILIPTRALQTSQNGQFVYVVTGPPDNLIVTPHNVSPTDTVDEFSIVQSDLKPGDTVVTDGQLRLTPGSRITLKPAVGSPSASPATATPLEIYNAP